MNGQEISTNNVNGTSSNEQSNIAANSNNNLPANNDINNNATIAQAQPLHDSSVTVKDNKFTSKNNDIVKKTIINNTAGSTKKNARKAKLPWTIEVYATSAYADKQTYDVVKESIIGMAAPIPPPQPKPALWNYGAGVRLGIPLAKKLTLKTGLQFAQTRLQADYQQQNVVDMIAISGFADTSRYRQIVYQSEKQQRTYNGLSIPVLIAYQTGKKLKVGAIAGVIVNAYSWYTGKVPNSTYTTILDAKETYRHNTGAAIYAGITIAKKIGAVEVFAEPHLQYSLNSYTKPTVLFKQNINTYGLSVGIRMALHK